MAAIRGVPAFDEIEDRDAGRGVCQYIALFAQPPILPPQPVEILAFAAGGVLPENSAELR